MSSQRDQWYASGFHESAGPGTGFDPAVAHSARVYDYWIGGKDNFLADRQVAEEVIRARPEVVAAARANRAFLARAVEFMARGCKIRQFLDIGTGIPAPDNTHEVAQRFWPDSRIVYVDNDPVVLSHARALLTSTPQGACAYVDADLRDTGTILEQAAGTLDFSKPVGLLLLAVLHFIPDNDDPAGIVAALTNALAPESLVAISHLTADFAPAQIAAAVKAYNTQTSVPVTARTHDEVTALFGGLLPVRPGLVPVSQWRPALADESCPPLDLYAGLAVVTRRKGVTPR